METRQIEYRKVDLQTISHVCPSPASLHALAHLPPVIEIDLKLKKKKEPFKGRGKFKKKEKVMPELGIEPRTLEYLWHVPPHWG